MTHASLNRECHIAHSPTSYHLLFHAPAVSARPGHFLVVDLRDIAMSPTLRDESACGKHLGAVANIRQKIAQIEQLGLAPPSNQNRIHSKTQMGIKPLRVQDPCLQVMYCTCHVGLRNPTTATCDEGAAPHTSSHAPNAGVGRRASHILKHCNSAALEQRCV